MMRVIARFNYSRYFSLMPRLQISARKQPNQRRSQATVETILAAAARVLTKHSLAGFNTNRVAEVAGVSVGSLYQYFPNKESLVAALIDLEQERLALAVEATVRDCAGKSLSEGLSALARLAIDQQYRNPTFAAALDHEERRLPIGSRLRGYEERLGTAVIAFLTMHRSALPADRVAPGVARDLLLISRALVEADAQEAKTPAGDLEHRLVRALTGYLTTP
ncbi:MAG: TetR/AcrR family transcriptional regulator [Pseudohongiellaceae bacterium]|jgi:AcrR family transcriptional regulator